jgi:hypothetical protein
MDTENPASAANAKTPLNIALETADVGNVLHCCQLAREVANVSSARAQTTSQCGCVCV